ncbi:hypothetical protein [Pseudoalteromonas xiamenensis]|uniref:Uncharacterized protein n=1 Tax=Pseudoalteromonas xiamenensis TaxID=882626 RepID=A0A975DIT5_9GAMM|nr:hypothetical protein [Pseudoalteromonas xiamenensis]QTH72558.1 hypothetical protein J5O05_07080 [Pseudoalteromonas xiamenensis]
MKSGLQGLLYHCPPEAQYKIAPTGFWLDSAALPLSVRGATKKSRLQGSGFTRLLCDYLLEARYKIAPTGCWFYSAALRFAVRGAM